MPFKYSDVSVHTGCTARFKDLVYLSSEDRELREDDVEHTRFVGIDQSEYCAVDDVNWRAAALCIVRYPVEKLLAISEDGDVFTYVGGDSGHETIAQPVSVLRALGVIEGQAYACGMKRQVFRRTGEGSWVSMHAPEPEENAGFESIDGFNAGEIYAVGWRGEIWSRDESTWKQVDSPTGLILTGVCCAGDGKVYACGQRGTLLRGRNEGWANLQSQELVDDFWDLCWFNDRLYVASMSNLYEMTEKGLESVDFGEDRPATFNWLTHAEGVLWSVGSDDVFSFDGTNWVRHD